MTMTDAIITLTTDFGDASPYVAAMKGVILAPVAAHLSLGLDPAQLGPALPEWLRLQTPGAAVVPGGVTGEVAFVDDFGNLISNIPATLLTGTPGECSVGGRALGRLRWVR